MHPAFNLPKHPQRRGRCEGRRSHGITAAVGRGDPGRAERREGARAREGGASARAGESPSSEGRRSAREADQRRPHAHCGCPPRAGGAGQEGREALAWLGGAGREREAKRASAGRHAARGMADVKEANCPRRTRRASERTTTTERSGGRGRAHGRAGQAPAYAPSGNNRFPKRRARARTRP